MEQTDVKNNGLGKATFIKPIVFCVLGILCVSGNFLLENNSAVGKEGTNSTPVVINYDKETFIPDNAVIRFAPDAAGGKSQLDFIKQNGNREQIFELRSGKFWGNFSISNARVNFLIDDVVLIPNHAQFDLEYFNNRIELSVFGGDVYMGFLGEEGGTITDYQDFYSPLFVNRLLVPRETKVSIPLHKIDEHLDVLLYTKLVKEFKYSPIPAEKTEDDWVVSNIKKDRAYREHAKQTFISDIFNRGLRVREGIIDSAVVWFGKELTFVPELKKQRILDEHFSYLNDVLFYANSNDGDKSDARLAEFYAHNVDMEFVGVDEYYDRLDSYIDYLIVFTPEDPQYSILAGLLDESFLDGHDKYEVINTFWLDVYDGLDFGKTLAHSSLNQYHKYLSDVLGSSSEDLEFQREFVSYQNQLFDTLLLRKSMFYKEAYFEIKSILEDTLMDLYEEGQLKEEFSQAFIVSKIDFLKRLRTFFFDEEVPLKDAREILVRLVREIKDLLMIAPEDLAVVDLFEDRLDDIGDFWDYLDDSEYNSSKIYGDTHEERYKFYLDEKDYVSSFLDVQSDILGEVEDPMTISDVEKEIIEVFASFEDISDLETGYIQEVNQRYVDVKAVIGGFPFEAIFDREYLSLNNVYVYNELITDRSVKIASLLKFLQNKFSDLADLGNIENDDFTEETNAQIIARISIATKFSKLGFVIEMDDISVVDQKAVIYRVEDVYLEEYPDVSATFDYLAGSEEKVKNFYLTVYGSPVVLKGEYTLDELMSAIIAEDELYNLEPEEEEESSDDDE